MKTAIEIAEKEIAELWSSPSDQPSYTKILEVLERVKILEKRQTIHFAQKCTLVRNIDLDGNVIFCFDPAELFEITFTTNKETLK